MKRLIIITFMLILLSVVACVNGGYYSIAKLKMEIYNPKRQDYVIVIDYTKNIFSDRLFVIDMKTGKIVIKSTVSHARNSGILYPTDFSNTNESKKSCKGNFITKGVKYGKFGYSMIISGLDYSLNGNAKNRLIIFHSSKKMKSRIWSSGCFATPENTNKKIIDLTNSGCLVTVISK